MFKKDYDDILQNFCVKIPFYSMWPLLLGLPLVWKNRRRHGHHWPPNWRLWKPFIWDASDRSQVSTGLTTSATRLSHHIPVSRQSASKLLAVASQSLAILPEWVRRSQPTRLFVPTSTYHLVACLVGTGSAVLVDQTTDGSTRFVTTSATCPRRYGDQPFFVAMAQEWRNGPRWLHEHVYDDDDESGLNSEWLEACLMQLTPWGRKESF